MTTPPKIGEYWPDQGGVYAGIVRDHKAGQQWHLILAVADEAKLKGEYGSYGTSINATSVTDGQHNTKAMLAAGSELAKAATALSIDGHADFYIPAQKELNLLYINLQDHCAQGWHWSSTQDGAYYAWIQGFEDGYQFIGSKDYSRAARAVRRYYPLNNSAI